MKIDDVMGNIEIFYIPENSAHKNAINLIIRYFFIFSYNKKHGLKISRL